MVVECTRKLDSFEFIMAIEDCFGISIPDADAEQIETVGDLYDYVRERVPAGSSTECLSAKAFYRLRRSLVRVTGRARESIRPETVLEELLPDKKTRVQQWASLEQELGHRLPPLDLPKGVIPVLTVLLLALVGAGFVGRYWMPLVMWPLAAAVFFLAMRFLPRMARHIRACRTVGELAKLVQGRGCSLDEDGASDRQVWEAIAGILGALTGMDKSQITRELRFDDIPKKVEV